MKPEPKTAIIEKKIERKQKKTIDVLKKKEKRMLTAFLCLLRGSWQKTSKKSRSMFVKTESAGNSEI